MIQKPLRGLLLVSLLVTSDGLAGSRRDLGKGSLFLGMADNDRYIVYFRPNNLELGEYTFGRMITFDRAENREWGISDSSSIYENLSVRWSTHEQCLVVSDGKQVYGIDISSGKTRKEYFKADSLAVVICFAMAPNGLDYCVAIRRIEAESTKVRFLRRSILKHDQMELCSWDDSSAGEVLIPKALWGNNHDVSLLMPQPRASLLYFTDGRSTPVDTSVRSLHFLRDRKLFYSKVIGNKSVLFRWDVKKGSRLDIMSGEGVEFSYVGPYGSDRCIAVGVEQELLLYCQDTRKVHKLSSFPKGRCLYLGDGFEILEVNRHLTLLRVE
jgi:hypothetical protein